MAANGKDGNFEIRITNFERRGQWHNQIWDLGWRRSKAGRKESSGGRKAKGIIGESGGVCKKWSLWLRPIIAHRRENVFDALAALDRFVGFDRLAALVGLVVWAALGICSGGAINKDKQDG